MATALVAFVLLLMPGDWIAEASFPGGNGRIAFTRDGSIWLIDPDGSDLVELTSGYGPAFSSDGTKIAFRMVWRVPAPSCSSST